MQNNDLNYKGQMPLFLLKLFDYQGHTMYKTIFLFFILTVVSTSTVFSQNTEKPSLSKLVFRHYNNVSKEGEQKINTMQDSLIKLVMLEVEVDSLTQAVYKEFSMANIFKSTPETETHIDIRNDTIWRYTKNQGKIVGDYNSIGRNNGILYFHSKNDISVVYSEFKLFDVIDTYEVLEFPNDTKNIMGYDCYKVRISIENNEKAMDNDFPLNLGSTIFEMYVTKEINLPVHALINITKDFSSFFPLEVKTWLTSLEGNQEIYEIKSIE